MVFASNAFVLVAFAAWSALPALSAPISIVNGTQLSAEDYLKNGEEAQILNGQFLNLKSSDECQSTHSVIFVSIYSQLTFTFLQTANLRVSVANSQHALTTSLFLMTAPTLLSVLRSL